jgi:hypothetical protein
VFLYSKLVEEYENGEPAIHASGADVLEQYLAPDPQEKEIVILSDSDASTGVMASGRNTVALSASATQLLRSLLGTGCYDAATDRTEMEGCRCMAEGISRRLLPALVARSHPST